MSSNLARFGGEEFLVLLPATQLAGATVLAERMRVAVRSLPLAFRATAPTASFGVAEWVPGDTVTSVVTRRRRPVRGNAWRTRPGGDGPPTGGLTHV